FATKLLTMLAVQERDEGLRQIAFIAAERRLQIRVASQASEEIAISDLQVNSIKQLTNATKELGWTVDTPSELSEVLVAAFPRFEKTALHADQYLTLNSNHHKGEALRRAIAEVEGLQKS